MTYFDRDYECRAMIAELINEKVDNSFIRKMSKQMTFSAGQREVIMKIYKEWKDGR